MQPFSRSRRAFLQRSRKCQRETHALTDLRPVFGIGRHHIRLQRTDLIVCRRASVDGKNRAVLTLAQNAAIQEKAVVAGFSLEMSKEQLRCAARVEAKVIWLDFARLLTRDDGEDRRAIATLADAKIFSTTTPGVSVLEMRAKRVGSRRSRNTHLVVVDYMQLRPAADEPSHVTGSFADLA